VKIQHEGIEEALESDLRNVSMLEGVVNLAGPRGMKAGPIFDEVLRRFREELDYRLEARNQEAFRVFHEGDGIRIPRVMSELSTQRVLTSEWVTGMSLEEAADKAPELRRQYAEVLWRFVFRGNLVGGAFNADPHPGNYLFHEDGTVTFLDFGCVQPIANETRTSAVRAHQGAVRGDMETFHEATANMLGTHGGTFGAAAASYTSLCFQPLFSPKFHLTKKYAASLVREARELKKSMSAKDGSFVQPPPHLALMNRLQFGFYSVLAKLDVEVDYQSVEARFLDEAAQAPEGRLALS